MQVSVENKGNLERQMNITVPAKDIEKSYNERIANLQKSVKVDGFREGKVPEKVVKEKYGEKVMTEVANDVIGKSMDEAFKKEKVRPAGQPHVHNTDMPKIGEDYSYHIHFEVFPEFEPTKYTGMKITKPVAEPTEKMTKGILERVTASAQMFKAKKGAAKNADRVTINAEGFKVEDDTAIDGSKLENHKVVLGSNALIPGFEDALEGTKAGDKKSFEVTFPKDYHAEELKGVKARFDAEIVEVEAPEKAELNDEMAKNFGAENVADLKNKIKEQVASDLTNAAELSMKKDMFDTLCNANKFDVPNTMVENEFKQLMAAQMQELQQRGLGIEALGKSEDEIQAEFKELAARRVRLGLILSEIAKKEDIKVTPADVEAEIEKVAASYGPQGEQVKAFYAQPQNRGQIEGPLFERNVVAWIVENGKVTEKKMDGEKLLNGEV